MIGLTVLGGYLGAGKTTLLNKLLNGERQRRLAVLVNDFGAVNIDAALIRNANTRGGRGPILELSNGCVCCSVQDDLGRTLESIRGTGIDHVVIETSGVAMPAKVADYGNTWPGYQLAATLVVVDASNIGRQRRDKYIGALVSDQITQADLLLASKLDLLPAEEAQRVMSSLPDPCLAVSQGDSPLDLIVDSRPSAPGRRDRLWNQSGAHPDFQAITLSPSADLSAPSVASLLESLPPSVVRIKGWFRDGGRSWLVQGIGERRTLEPLPTTHRHPGTRLVFIFLTDRKDPNGTADRIRSLIGEASSRA